MNGLDNILDEIAAVRGAPQGHGNDILDEIAAVRGPASPAGPSLLSRVGEAAKVAAGAVKGAAGKVAEVATAPETVETLKNVGRAYGETLKDVTLAPLAPLRAAAAHPDVALEVAPGAALGVPAGPGGVLAGAALNAVIPAVAGGVKGALWGPGEPSLKNVRQGMLDTSATARMVDEMTGGAKPLAADVPRETSEVAQRYNLRALEGGYLPAPELSDEEKKALLNPQTYQEDQLRHGTHPMTPAEVEERKATIYHEPLTDIVTMGAAGGAVAGAAKGLSKLAGVSKLRLPAQGEFKLGGDVTGTPSPAAAAAEAERIAQGPLVVYGGGTEPPFVNPRLQEALVTKEGTRGKHQFGIRLLKKPPSEVAEAAALPENQPIAAPPVVPPRVTRTLTAEERAALPQPKPTGAEVEGKFLEQRGMTPDQVEAPPPEKTADVVPYEGGGRPQTPTVPDMPAVESPATEIPATVQRIEEQGTKVGGIDKPHGLYTSPADVKSPHAELGGDRATFKTNPDANVLNLGVGDEFYQTNRGMVGQSAGVKAARALMGDAEVARMMRVPKGELAAELQAKYSQVDWSRYYDQQEMVEAVAGIEARKAGYDAIFLGDKNPAFNEYVALNDKAFLPAVEAPTAAPRTPTWVNEEISPTPEPPIEKRPKLPPSYVEDPKFRYVIDHGGIKPYRKGFEAEENARIFPLLRKDGLPLDEMAENMNSDLGTHWASGDELRQYLEGGQKTPRASIEHLAKNYEAKKYGGAKVENSRTINVDELKDGQTIYQDGAPVVVSVGDQNVTLRSPEKRGWTAIIRHDAPPSQKMIDVDIEPPPIVKAQQAHTAARDATLDTIERELSEHEQRLTLANINRIAPEGIKTGLTPEQVETANHFLQDPTASESKITNNLRQAFYPEWRGNAQEIPGLTEYLRTIPPQYRDVRGVLLPDAVNDAATNGLIPKPDLREMRMLMKGGSRTLKSNKGREAAEAMLARLAESESGAVDPAAVAKAVGKVWTADYTGAKPGEGFGIRGPAAKAINAITSRWPTLGRVFNSDPAFYVRFEGKQIGPEIVESIERGTRRAKVIEQHGAEAAKVIDERVKELNLGVPEKARIQGLMESNPDTWTAEDKAILQKVGAAKFDEAGNRVWSLRDEADEYGALIERYTTKERVPLNRHEIETFKAALDKEPTAYTEEDVGFFVEKLGIPERSARSPGFDLRNSYGVQQGVDPRFGEAEFAYHVKSQLKSIHNEYDPATGTWKEVRYLTRSYYENLSKDHVEDIVQLARRSHKITGGGEYDALMHRNPELADKLERIIEPAFAAMQTAKNQGRILGNAEMTHELATRPGYSYSTKEAALAAGVRQPKWIPLAEAGDAKSMLWGELAGRWVDPRVAYQLLRGWGLVEEAKGLAGIGSELLAGSEMVMSAWKKNVVAKVPMSALRDSITNATYYFQYYGGSPTHPWAAFKGMAREAQSAELQRFIHEGGAVGSGINSHEFRSSLIDAINESDPFKATTVADKIKDVVYAVGEHTWGGRTVAEGIGRIAGGSPEQLKTLAKIGIDPHVLRFREKSDTYWKFAIYLSEREKGATVRQAVQAANYHVYGMQQFPLYVRAMRATGWPFLGFTYFALTRTPEALIRHPAAFLITAGMMGTSIPVLSKLIEDTDTYGDIYSTVMGITPQEGKRRKEFLPSFVSEATTLNLPFATGNGNSLILDFGPNTPLGDISTLFNMERGLYDRAESIGRMRPLTPGGPGIGTYDILRGINPVNQQRLLPDIYTESGPLVKKQLAALYKMLGPDPWVMNTIGKTLTAAREEEDTRGMKWGVPLTVYNALSPLKAYPVNPDVQMRAAMGKEHRFEGEFKQLKRQVLRNPKLTDDEKQEKIDELRRQLEERRKQAERLL